LRKVNLIVLAECYANKCLAVSLIAIMRGRIPSVEAKIKHNEKMGRDRILKVLDRVRGRLGGAEVLLAVIDYERGIARKYVEANFKILATYYDNIVHIAVFKEPKVISIILDPDIGEFLCKTTKRYCSDSERRELKRGGQDEVFRKLQDLANVGLSHVIGNLVDTLVAQLGETL